MSGNEIAKFNAVQAIRDVQHFGEEGGVVPVIDVAATSTFLNPEDLEKTMKGELEGCYLYSRHQNPSVQAFSKKLAAMEKMPAAVGVASGMAAVSAVVDQIASSGDHIVSSRTVYGGTYALFQNILKKRGIEVTFVNHSNLDEVKKAIKPNTKIIYTETMSNPLLDVPDLLGLSKLAKSVGAKLVVDNTFTPLVVTPSQWGADVVIYSATKFLSGSSDMIAGAIVSSAEFIKSLLDINSGSVMLGGAILDSRLAHELYMRLDHLPLRMKAHAEVALKFAKRFEELGLRALYPALPSHMSYEIFSSLSNKEFGAGGVVTLDCKTKEKARRLSSLLQEKKFGLYAVSLGFSRTLMSCPSLSTSSEIPELERNQMGMTDSLLRLSLGFTGDIEIMWQRFMEAAREAELI